MATEDKHVAIIAPTNLLEMCSTNYHLVLTQYMLKDSTYAKFYKDRRAKGEFIILDNGAAELKKSLTSKDVFRVAMDLKPNLVIAPDVIYKAEETWNGTNEFIGDYGDALSEAGVNIMAVPQGQDLDEWYNCFMELNDHPNISWLGISMFYTPKSTFGRVELLHLISGDVQKPCHLLGLWDNPYDLLKERKYKFVKSVDTAKPVEFGLEGLRIRDWFDHKHIDDDEFFAIKANGDSISPLLTQVRRNVTDFTKLFVEGVAC